MATPIPQLPNACDFEIANYTILLWETGRANETLTFGPKEHYYRNGRSVTREIPFDPNDPDLIMDAEYLMIINVTTPAGISTSGIISFCECLLLKKLFCSMSDYDCHMYS